MYIANAVFNTLPKLFQPKEECLYRYSVNIAAKYFGKRWLCRV